MGQMESIPICLLGRYRADVRAQLAVAVCLLINRRLQASGDHRGIEMARTKREEAQLLPGPAGRCFPAGSEV